MACKLSVMNTQLRLDQHTRAVSEHTRLSFGHIRQQQVAKFRNFINYWQGFFGKINRSRFFLAFADGSTTYPPTNQLTNEPVSLGFNSTLNHFQSLLLFSEE